MPTSSRQPLVLMEKHLIIIINVMDQEKEKETVRNVTAEKERQETLI